MALKREHYEWMLDIVIYYQEELLGLCCMHEEVLGMNRISVIGLQQIEMY